MKIANIIESIISEYGKRVTQNMWKKMSDDEKENALLTIFKDPDDRRFEDFLFSDWNKLPGWAKRDMRTEGKLNESFNIKKFNIHKYKTPAQQKKIWDLYKETLKYGSKVKINAGVQRLEILLWNLGELGPFFKTSDMSKVLGYAIDSLKDWDRSLVRGDEDESFIKKTTNMLDLLNKLCKQTLSKPLVKKPASLLTPTEGINENITLKGKDAGSWIENWGRGGRVNIDNMIYRSLGKGKWKGPTGKTMSWKEVAALAVEEGDNRVYLEGKVNEISAGAGMKDILKGRTSSIEGIKMSKELVHGITSWIANSPYGHKYGKQILKGRIHSMIGPANAFGIERYLKKPGTKKEWQAIYKKHGPKREGVNEANFKYFREYLGKMGKHLGDRDLMKVAKTANDNTLRQMYKKDLHFQEFKDSEVKRFDAKKLHNMIKYDQRFNEAEGDITTDGSVLTIKSLTPETMEKIKGLSSENKKKLKEKLVFYKDKETGKIRRFDTDRSKNKKFRK